MKLLRQIIYVAGLTCLVLVGSNCEKNSTGVCTGYSSEFNSTYCKDGWTKSECEEWDDLEVNGISWNFHKGQTCDERGTPATP